MLESCGLSWRLWFVALLNEVEAVGVEEDGTVAVGLEVDTDVVLGGGLMVEMLHTRGGNGDWETERLLDECGGGAVGVRGLNDTNLEVAETSGLGEVGEEGSRKRGNLVTIEKVKGSVLGGIVVDNTISITVKGGITTEWDDVQPWRELLLSLDKIGSALNRRQLGK
jgi:hypothetical protein